MNKGHNQDIYGRLPTVKELFDIWGQIDIWDIWDIWGQMKNSSATYC